MRINIQGDHVKYKQKCIYIHNQSINLSPASVGSRINLSVSIKNESTSHQLREELAIVLSMQKDHLPFTLPANRKWKSNNRKW